MTRTVERLTKKGFPVACVEEVVPDVTACQVWLYNRQTEKWKRRRETQPGEREDKPLNIQLVNGSTPEADRNALDDDD
jgi:hypothetical protein